MPLITNLAFPHSWEVEEIRELPGTGKFAWPVFYFPGSATRPAHDGLWISIHPSGGNPWVGVFAFGDESGLSKSLVVSTPNPDRLCVVSQGRAYFVDALNPSRWEELPISPVRHVRPLPEHGIVLFADFNNLAAFGPGGLVWRSPRLCWDDLEILTINADRIEGEGYDPLNSGIMPIAVDLKTGRSLLPPPLSADGTPIW